MGLYDESSLFHHSLFLGTLWSKAYRSLRASNEEYMFSRKQLQVEI
jgi:hypothetical protein